MRREGEGVNDGGDRPAATPVGWNSRPVMGMWKDRVGKKPKNN